MGKTTNLNWLAGFQPSTVWWADITHLGHWIHFVCFISSIRWCGWNFHPARHRWERKSSQWSTCTKMPKKKGGIKTNPDTPCMGIYTYIYLKNQANVGEYTIDGSHGKVFYLAGTTCRDMVPIVTRVDQLNQVRYIKDMNVYIVTAVISLFAYLWSRPKLPRAIPKLPIHMISRESWRKNACSPSRLFGGKQMSSLNMSFFDTFPPQNENDTKGCPFGTGNICICFVFAIIIPSKKIYYRRSHFSITYYWRCVCVCFSRQVNPTEALPCGVGYLRGSWSLGRCLFFMRPQRTE